MADVRLIDANALRITNITERKTIFIDGRRRSTFVYGEVVRIKDLQNAPTVDAVPVVRCKDCKIAFANPFFADYPQLVCRKWANWHIVEPNDFCSCGERKDDEICKED